eukprot:SAG25_NODE_20_length_23237_cov_58.179229_26_plen_83_part_00
MAAIVFPVFYVAMTLTTFNGDIDVFSFAVMFPLLFGITIVISKMTMGSEYICESLYCIAVHHCCSYGHIVRLCHRRSFSLLS